MPASREYETYYAIIREIPAGRVMSYGDVAGRAGSRRHARRVGYALFTLGDPGVPWWRVVNARGGISRRRREGRPSESQRALLEAEGVSFDAEGRIDMERFRHRREAPGGPPRDPWD